MGLDIKFIKTHFWNVVVIGIIFGLIWLGTKLIIGYFISNTS